MDEQTQRILELRTRQKIDHIGSHRRQDTYRQIGGDSLGVNLGRAQAASALRQSCGNRREARSVVRGYVGVNFNLLSGGVMGTTLTTWAKDSDHTVTFGAGEFQWQTTMFPFFFVGTPSEVMAVGSFSSTVVINLLGPGGAILKTASCSSTATNSGGATDTLSTTVSAITYDGNGPITSFNAYQAIISGSPEMSSSFSELFFLFSGENLLTFECKP